MIWVKDFLRTYGLAGALSLSLLLLSGILYQHAKIMLVGVPESTASNEKTVSIATAEQLAHHMRQAEEQTNALRAIQVQLQKNHDLQSVGARLTCIRLSKTDWQRDECAKIQ